VTTCACPPRTCSLSRPADRRTRPANTSGLAVDRELDKARFREAVSALLERPVRVVATMQSAWHPFTDTLKRRSGIETLRLTRANCDDLAKALTDRLPSAR
jgi:hypothetical protein